MKVKLTKYANRAITNSLFCNRKMIIRKSGNIIELSQDSRTPLPRDFRELIEPQLTYVHKHYIRNKGRYGGHGNIELESVPLYRYDGLGRLCCGVGFLPKIQHICDAAKVKYEIIDCHPKHPRPNRFCEDWDSLVNKFEFKAKQKDCVIQIASNDFGIIKAPTGFGKGMLIAMISTLYPNSVIHIVTPSKDLVSKTVRLLTKYLPNVGQVGCGKKNIEKITVFSADSLHLSDGDCDILLCDEIHKLAAPTYSSALARYRFSRNFGFSATPTGRLDGADAKLESLFGPVIFELSYEDAVKLNLVVPIEVHWLDVRCDNPCSDKQGVAKKRWGIWRNDFRNKAIADKVKEFDDDEQVLILVETIEHLMFLREFLPDFNVCYSENGLTERDMGMYKRNGLMPENEQPLSAKDREQLRQDFESGKIKKAIATGVWATGVDFVHLPVLVRADAMGSEIMDTQAPGRVSRTCATDNKQVGIVIDCLDQFDNSFRNKAISRKKNYQLNGWKQILPYQQNK